MNHKFYIAGVWGSGNQNALKDVNKRTDAVFLKKDFAENEKLRNLNKFIRTTLKGKGFRILDFWLELPFWDNKYELTKIKYDKNCINYIIIFNSALLHYYSKRYLERLKKIVPNIKLILFVIDPMPNGLWRRMQGILKCFDKVATIHECNEKKYGFKYIPFFYSKIIEEEENIIKENDLYYCGILDSYRAKFINIIRSECLERNIDYKFWIVKRQEVPFIEDEKLIYKKEGEMSYENNIRELLKSKCILEIMHEGYVGITQRYLEAVVYNKKLLTNNADVFNMEYYSPDRIQYFNDVNDINWEWVNMDEKIDFQYAGNYSVNVWLENITKLFG